MVNVYITILLNNKYIFRLIEKAIEYYSNKTESDEYNFKLQLNQVLDTLESNPFFQFRYKKIRAIPFKNTTVFSVF
ncbi:MAG TPA: hypothetical protein DDZ41_08300 [Flavobacterium sp.]|nr:hypothetical protein [Flavobacterium sp.]